MKRRSGPIDRIDAVTLLTVDMVASVAFYRAAGFEIAYGDSTSAIPTATS